MLTRPDPPSPKLRLHSDPAKLKFAWEPFHKITRELPPLFQRHWAELALDRDCVPLDPDWDVYFNLDLVGKLHILTAREAPKDNWTRLERRTVQPTGQLEGYVFNLVGGHLHYASTTFAHTEMFWLSPAFRQGSNGVRMLRANLDGLRERGVEVATINFKLGFKDARVGKLLARLGYQATDIVMRKIL